MTVQGSEPMRVTGKQLYQAVNGLGLQIEIPGLVRSHEALLVRSDVVEPSRKFNKAVFLHEIKLKNGSTIHLG